MDSNRAWLSFLKKLVRLQRDFSNDNAVLGQAFEIDVNVMIGQGIFLCLLNHSQALFAINIQFHKEIFRRGGLYSLVKLLGFELDVFRFTIAIDDAGQSASVAEFFAADGLGQHTRISCQ